MKLKLTKPLCFFDLETTGTDVSKDRIIEIAIIKVNIDGSRESLEIRLNPGIPIPPESTLIHGITDEMVANEPIFKDKARNIYNFLKGCDLAGFNSDRFDIPLLVEELLRADLDFDFKNTKTIDVQNIFHKMESRTLSAALKFYCDKELTDAHTAIADANATLDVLLAQLDRYSELEPNVDFLNHFSTRKKTADFAGFLIYNKDDEICFGFGKHKGKKVNEILKEEPGYFGWILNADFPRYTKKILTEIKLNSMNNKE
ncbi:MAG: 3'-5' exonuclease [Bacteroidota bacterium]|nr:3'-5' exonuclease [Bacteroidota bacterium]